MKPEALVTGGAGFIGSALCRELAKRDFRVSVLDNLSFGRTSNLPVGVRLVKGDIRSTRDLRRVLDRTYFAVFHLAALHFIPYCNAHPEETIDVNVAGTIRLLSELRRRAPKRLFFASTAAVYDCSSRKHREDERLDPIDVYGLSKLVGETFVSDFALSTGVPCAIGRLFNAYGPNETNPHLIPSILEQLRGGKPVLALGNLTPFRDYIHTSDMTRAISQLTLHAPRGCATANVGSGKEQSVRGVVKAFERALGKRIRVKSAASLRRKSERAHLRADLSILRRTGFRCRVPFADGIRDLWRKEGLGPACA